MSAYPYKEKTLRNHIWTSNKMNRPFRISRCLVFIGTILFGAQSVSLNKNVCKHYLCESTSMHILLNANLRAPPCADFFEYACGLFIRDKSTASKLHSLRYLEMITHKVLEKLRHLLEQPAIQNETRLEWDAKHIYKACMNTEKINYKGYESFESFMNIVDGWPMILEDVEWDLNKESWDVVHHHFKRLTSIGSLVDLRIYAHKYIDNVPMIHLEQPRFLFGIYNPFVGTTYKNYYKEFIRNLALLFIKARGSVVSPVDLHNDIINVLDFRRRLAENMLWGSNARKVYGAYSTYTLEDLQLWYEKNDIDSPKKSRINWTQLVLKSFLFDIRPVNQSEKVVIRNPKYIFNLMHILGTTPRRTILNHIHLHFVENHIRYAPTAARKEALLLFQRMTGLSGLPETDRWKFCITEHPLQHVLGKMYSNAVLLPSTRKTVKTMANTIKMRLKSRIQLATWIHERTKRKAVQKLNELQIVSGYPDWYDDPLALAQYYRSQMAGDEALANALSYAQHKFRLETVVLRSNPPRTASDEYPTDRTVVYLVEKNALHINAAMLQWPYFNEALPENINYATLGVMISREIIHAIDTIGIRFNENGRPEDWWGKSLPLYEKKLGCIVSKYTNTTEPRLALYTNQISDTLAIRLAADAYLHKSLDQPRKQPPHLPGLKNYSDMKSFFLAAASFNCDKILPKYNGTVAETDLYNLFAYRINIPMRLSWEFSRAYECYEFAYKNPQFKCEIWSDD